MSESSSSYNFLIDTLDLLFIIASSGSALALAPFLKGTTTSPVSSFQLFLPDAVLSKNDIAEINAIFYNGIIMIILTFLFLLNNLGLYMSKGSKKLTTGSTLSDDEFWSSDSYGLHIDHIYFYHVAGVSSMIAVITSAIFLGTNYPKLTEKGRQLFGAIAGSAFIAFLLTFYYILKFNLEDAAAKKKASSGKTSGKI